MFWHKKTNPSIKGLMLETEQDIDYAYIAQREIKTLISMAANQIKDVPNSNSYRVFTSVVLTNLQYDKFNPNAMYNTIEFVLPMIVHKEDVEILKFSVEKCKSFAKVYNIILTFSRDDLK